MSENQAQCLDRRGEPPKRESDGYARPSVADEAEWLSVEEASNYSGLPANTIYRLVRDGKLNALRFPVRVRRSDLDRGFERSGSSRGS